MHEKEQNINYELLVIRQLQNVATEDELWQLASWIQESPENKHKEESIRKIWMASENTNFPALDVDAEWLRFKEKAGIGKIRKNTTTAILLKVAAVFLLGLFSVFAYLFIPQASEKTYMAESSLLEVSLDEGSTVVLNRNATLIVPPSFNKDQRTVYLKGDAYFDVKKGEKPFFVHADRVSVKVLGTSFYIDDRENLKNAEVIVKNGLVRVSASEDHDNHIVLRKGEVASLKKQVLNKQFSFDPNYLAWKTRKISFENTPMQEVVNTLNKVYGVTFRIDESLTEKHLTADFNNQKLEEVLHIISLTLDVRIEKQGEQVSILPS